MLPSWSCRNHVAAGSVPPKNIRGGHSHPILRTDPDRPRLIGTDIVADNVIVMNSVIDVITDDNAKACIASDDIALCQRVAADGVVGCTGRLRGFNKHAIKIATCCGSGGIRANEATGYRDVAGAFNEDALIRKFVNYQTFDDGVGGAGGEIQKA